MTAKHYRLIAWSLALSFASGVAILLYGATNRELPPRIDLIWTASDQIRAELQSGSLTLKEGEGHDRTADRYRLSVRRLPKDATSLERYVLQIRSMYELLPSSAWRPSSWDIGFIASGDGGDRRVYLVATRKLKD